MTDANFNPIYGFDVGSLPLGADVKLLSTLAVNKTRIGSLGSDRIGLVFSLLLQKNYFEKSCF